MKQMNLPKAELFLLKIRITSKNTQAWLYIQGMDNEMETLGLGPPFAADESPAQWSEGF